MREDRSRQLLQVQDLQTEVAKYKECTVKYTADLESVNTKKVELEVCFSIVCFLLKAYNVVFNGFIIYYFFQSTCLSQSEQIRRLQEQLASAEKKLQVVDLALSFMIYTNTLQEHSYFIFFFPHFSFPIYQPWKQDLNLRRTRH